VEKTRQENQENKEHKQLRSLDFFLGLFFAAVGVYMCIAAFSMFNDPMLRAIGTPKTSNPGMTTVVIGGLLVLMGTIMALLGLAGSRKPFSVGGGALGEMFRSERFWKSLLVLGLIAVYFFVLWNNTPYWFSTMLFLCATMRIFKAGAWWKIILISALTTAFILYFFGKLALVPLPSEPGWLNPIYKLLGR